MVTTKLYEVASKGRGWMYGKGNESTDATPPFTPSRPAMVSQQNTLPQTKSIGISAPGQYLDYANTKIKGAAEQTYSTIAGIISSTLYTGGTTGMFSPLTDSWRTSISPVHDDLAASSLSDTPSKSSRRQATLSARELVMMFKNPYDHVRGRHSQQSSYSSVTAVRSLLTLIPQTENERMQPMIHDTPINSDEDDEHTMDESWRETPHKQVGNRGSSFLSPAESASQIAEGTVRALRDIALDEAVELHAALRFWSERWERPLLSWMEAGPLVWSGGYKHQAIGRKVAQIQAILARRCANIGELQTHMLRAGWHKGVAQWGVVGDGGQWAAVAGFDGFSGNDDENDRPSELPFRKHAESSELHPTDLSSVEFSRTNSRPTLERMISCQSEANIMVEKSEGGGFVVDDPVFLSEWSVEAIKLVRIQLERAANGAIRIPKKENWGIDVGSGGGDDDEYGQLVSPIEASVCPCWARESVVQRQSGPSSGDSAGLIEKYTDITITDLPAMAEEVSELIDIMVPVMALQRRRRLDKLCPPSWARRNWFILYSAGPCMSYVLYKMLRNDFAQEAFQQLAQKVKSFYHERIREPVVAIIQELWKGRAPFSDREARLEAIESLKKMIRNWLDENHPDLPQEEREALSASMDVTLIEKQKVESMKTFFEINNVIQMSFIEMQYMKKEMLNALEAIDQMLSGKRTFGITIQLRFQLTNNDDLYFLSANDINMNIAAITPVAILLFVSSRMFKFIYYALLKLGKSREETYASLRSILTDVERLLVMRDNPPQPPPMPGRKREVMVEPMVPKVLTSDDLGMLMLLLHGCRQILWREQRRFPPETIRSVSEDLAELAGERGEISSLIGAAGCVYRHSHTDTLLLLITPGPVSVQQQLLILNRMSRTYSFLSAFSTSHVGSSGLRMVN